MLRAGKRQATKMKVGHTHRFRVGQDCLGLVRERGSIKRQMCQRQRTREIFRDLCDVESAALGRTQDEHSRLCVRSNKGKKRRGYWDRQIHRFPFAQYVPRYKCVETAMLWRSGSMGLVRWDQRVFEGHCVRCGGGMLLIQWDRSMTM